MSILGRFVKQPAEILDYSVDFGEWLAASGQTPAGHTATAQPGIAVSSTLIGDEVRVVVSGGENGRTYKVTVLLTTSSGLVKEADFVVKIKEF